jgi:hypothetical protein
MTDGRFGREIGSHLRASAAGRCGVNQQQRRSNMPCEILKDDSKDQAKVVAKIKSYWQAQTKQNDWRQIIGWKKPADTWYNLVEDGATIEIKTLHNDKPDHHFVVLFEGVPKVGKQVLRVNVGTLPFKK